MFVSCKIGQYEGALKTEESTVSNASCQCRYISIGDIQVRGFGVAADRQIVLVHDESGSLNGDAVKVGG